MISNALVTFVYIGEKWVRLLHCRAVFIEGPRSCNPGARGGGGYFGKVDLLRHLFFD
jgi:hypothetical protein